MLFALKQMTVPSKNNRNRTITRRQYEISRKAIVEAASGSEHGRSVSAGMARRKEELGPAAHGKATSAGIARRKEELGPEAYAARCAELGNAISAGLVRRKEELGPEEYSAWCAEVGKASSAGKLKNSPHVRCLNDGKEHENAVAAANFYGLRSDNIHAVCQGRYKTTGGLRFEYIERADAKRP